MEHTDSATTPPDFLTNIGGRERRIRLVLAVVTGVAAIALAAYMVIRDVAWGWHLALFPLFYQAIRFFFDYRTGTCPLKAELGQRRMEGWMTILGEEIRDEPAAARIRAISRRALGWSVGLAALLTLAVLLA